MCDPRDIGQTLGDGGSPEEDRAPGRDPFSGRTGGFDPTVFLFDALPGGVGLAPRIYERADELLERARDLIDSCDCDAGCPACVGPTEEHGSRKEMSSKILAGLRGDAAAAKPVLAEVRGLPYFS